MAVDGVGLVGGWSTIFPEPLLRHMNGKFCLNKKKYIHNMNKKKHTKLRGK